MTVLYRFKELPTNNHATVLFVGVKGIGMDDLVENMLQTNTSYSMQIRTTTSLPLPEHTGTTESRPRIDYIVFVTDLASQQSFKMINEAVELVNIDYFFGRCCFIVSKAKQESVHGYDINDVTNLVEAYDAVMFCGNLDKKDERLNLVDKILHHVEIACGFYNDVNPSLIEATRSQAPSFEEITT